MARERERVCSVTNRQSIDPIRVLIPQTVILDVTSGNTGIGLVVPAIHKGYRTVFVMPVRA